MMMKRFEWGRGYQLITTALLGAAAFLPAGMTDARADDWDHAMEHWDMVTLRVDAPHRISLYGEVQSRTGLGFQKGEGMDRLILRGALGYRVTPSLSVWQGYGWTPSYQPRFNNENRIFQQSLLENHLKKLAIVNRSRLEERYIEGAGATALRFRHMLRLAYPLDKAQKWSAVTYDEYFVNLNRTPAGPQGGFDQNRLFVGLNRKANKYFNLETGYMMQWVNRHSGTPDRVNHIVLVSLNMTVK